MMSWSFSRTRWWNESGSFRFLVALLWCGVSTSVWSADWYVNVETGRDDQAGTMEAPLATAQLAVDKASPGDRIHLLPAGAVYRQSIRFGNGMRDLTLLGNGVTLTGADPLPEDGWEPLGENLHRIRLPKTALNRHLLIVDGVAQRMGRLTGPRGEFPAAEDLQDGEFRWDDADDRTGWLTYRGKRAGLEWSTRMAGIATVGDPQNITVTDLIARHCLNDGFNIHGSPKGLVFIRITGYENFDEGFSAHGTAECRIEEGLFYRNENGIADVNDAETYYENCVIRDNVCFDVLFYGARHGFRNSRIETSGTAKALVVRHSPLQDSHTATTTAIFQGMVIESSSSQPSVVEFGRGTRVFLDEASSRAEKEGKGARHPSARVTEALYQTAPIGRDAQGQPLEAWSVGGAFGVPSRAYRVMHLDRHDPADLAVAAAHDMDWLGLVQPLGTADFPPTGDAYGPENGEAHAIWRWIALSAPDLVIVPDSPEGEALAKALQKHPPAGVGTVEVCLSSRSPDGLVENRVVSQQSGVEGTLKEELLGRIGRTPREVLEQMAPHYGNTYRGGYVEAFALLAKHQAGVPTALEELARQHAETADLPKGGSDIAGTLLYTVIDQPWAAERIQRVADLAFDQTGQPLEAMPFHNEMSDAVFMASPLLAWAGVKSGEQKYFDQSLRNFHFIRERCQRPDGLYRHSPWNDGAWGRGNAFPALGLALVMDAIGPKHEHFSVYRDAFRAHMQALAGYQNDNGMWHQIVDQPDSYAEFTVTAMLGYAMARGIQQKWLDGNWEASLRKAWSGVKARIGTDGLTLHDACISTGKQKKWEDYYHRTAVLGRDDRGGAMALLFAAEMENWMQHRYPPKK